MKVNVPTPIISLVIFLATLIAVTALTVTGNKVDAVYNYILVGAVTAAIGAALPNVGQPPTP